jgi:lysozyme
LVFNGFAAFLRPQPQPVAKKKRKNTINIYLLLVCFLAIASATIWYLSKPRFVRYPAFGIDIPSGYAIHGIDVSYYQSSIDWEEVKTMEVKNVKIGFCFIKATEGADNTDNKFRRNWRKAKEAGITRGAYHFFNPYKSGKQQAQNFISAVSLQKGDMPPVLDVEQAGSVGKDLLQQRVGEWLLYVEQHYKVKPVIYSGAVFYSRYLEGKFDEYPLWVAHYLVKDKPRVGRAWDFWQHNETGRVNGIDANVDFNVFNGDSAAFKKLLVK